jgi:hypothetical protein
MKKLFCLVAVAFSLSVPAQTGGKKSFKLLKCFIPQICCCNNTDSNYGNYT